MLRKNKEKKAYFKSKSIINYFMLKAKLKIWQIYLKSAKHWFKQQARINYRYC